MCQSSLSSIYSLSTGGPETTPLTALQPLPSDERTKECPRRKPKYRILPPLPRDDFKVIVRPHQGLPIKSLTSPTLADAVITACGGLITGEQFLLRIKPGSNIFIISTPHQVVAEKISRIASLKVNGRPHAVNAYVATGEGATRGVIHGVQPHTPSEEIKANLRVRTQGVEVLQARMLGDTKTAVITFYGGHVPRFVYYRGGELPCYPYKNTTHVCKVCYHVDHRSDVCPQPDTPVCRICGMRDPVPSHECSPKCATCGEDHLTGDRTCKKRLKPLHRKRSKTSNTSTSHLPRGPGSTMTKKQLRWFSSEAEDLDVDWPGLPPASDSPRSKDQPLQGRSQPSISLLQRPQGQGSRLPQVASSRGELQVTAEIDKRIPSFEPPTRLPLGLPNGTSTDGLLALEIYNTFEELRAAVLISQRKDLASRPRDILYGPNTVTRALVPLFPLYPCATLYCSYTEINMIFPCATERVAPPEPGNSTKQFGTDQTRFTRRSPLRHAWLFAAPLLARYEARVIHLRFSQERAQLTPRGSLA
ncbi:hypothetical protein HPB52_019385 [Rhipicephalus sanguineus]|uniref:Uncharacterized protein n=1 Tax=Rhipicephalus sanguineus TaxID=34632 RepID=A0A9D4SQ26_RHISA|nr:hypothetical protein HPB52_019385 [Rhipicephalus sanguineus]